MANKVTAKSFGAAQIAQLYNNILKKDRHKKLCNVCENEKTSVVVSFVLLKHENICLENKAQCHCLHICNVFDKVPQKALEGHRDNRVLHPIDRAQEDAREHIL
ncbi:hypothetical protein PAEPH01_2166 [Pancytospora epiphaga]|nr:hypothetical protein PAEPH01_2166 [Pancytospora epiphaga]